MSDRYFSEDPVQGDKARLTGHEAHHLIHVMRAAPGTRVVLLDGSGAEFEAAVRHVARSEVELAVLGRAEVDRELPVELVLGVSLPKGDRQKWLVEKSVELGVRRLVPLRTTRSVAQPGPRTVGRLRRAVIEASKQCGRNRLMEVAPAEDWTDWVAAGGDAALRLLAHPGGQPAAPQGPAAEWPVGSQPAGPVLLAIGPEGGFTDDEATLAADAGWQLVDLGPRILRIETAAIYLVAMVVARVTRGGRESFSAKGACHMENSSAEKDSRPLPRGPNSDAKGLAKNNLPIWGTY